MSSRPDPFWLCHECHAQMRPIKLRDGTQTCASCGSEFIEILDQSVNPDPFAELPHPPLRPQSSPPAPGESDTGSGFFQNILGSLLGQAQGSSSSAPASPPLPQPHAAFPPTFGSSGQQHGGNGRTFSFQFPGGGRGSVVFGSFGGGSMGGMGNMGGGQAMGPFGPLGGDQGGGLDSIFPGFPPNARRGTPFNPYTRAPNGDQDMFAQQDFISALMEMLQREGNLDPHAIFGVPPNAQMGDYATSQQSFEQILEQLMQAAGPQGPIPATDAVIEGLPRSTFDAESLEKSVYKDCPVCKDDFAVGDEIMRIPCKHIFHPDCLQPWLKTNGSCPVCRFSLVPDDANAQARPSGQTGPLGQQASTGTAQSQTTPAGEGAQPLFAGILNRLWGQSGAAGQQSPPAANPGTPSAPSSQPTAAPSSGRPPPPPPLSTSAARNTPSGPSQTLAATTSSTTEDDDPAVPDLPGIDLSALSSSIPEDYRERHRRREREQEAQRLQEQRRGGGQSGGTGGTNGRRREREEEYPSYFS